MAPASRQDVIAEIERQFSADDRTAALKTINLIMGKPGEREETQLVILGQSNGTLDRLRGLVETAKQRPSSGRPSPQPITDAASAQRAQAAAAAHLVSARHVAGQDATQVVGGSREYYPFRWVFYIAIGLIPLYTFGGGYSYGIAAGGIGSVSRIITDANRPLQQRVLISVGITIGCWVLRLAVVPALFR